MTLLSPAQIAAVAAGAGFTGAGLRRAVAVALAESGGETTSVGYNTDAYRSRDRGLWQINSHWHPEVSDAAAFNPASAAAAAYRISRQGTDWSAWATWKNGQAEAQLPRARLAVHQAQAGHTTAPHFPTTPVTPSGGTRGPGTGAGGAQNVHDSHTSPEDLQRLGGDHLIPNPLAGLGDVAGGLKNLSESAASAVVVLVHAGAWLADRHNWSRIALVAGGGATVLLGLKLLADAGTLGSTAANVSGKAGTALAAVAAAA